MQGACTTILTIAPGLGDGNNNDAYQPMDTDFRARSSLHYRDRQKFPSHPNISSPAITKNSSCNW